MEFRKIARWVFPILLMVILGAMFLMVDFRLAKSTSEIRRTLQKYSYAKGDQGLDIPDHVQVVVSGRESLNEKLQRAMVDQLQQRSAFRHVDSLTSVDQGGDDPVLAVQLEKRFWLWTPLFGKSDFHVKVNYASNGDLSWRDDDVAQFSSSEVPDSGVVWLSGEFDLTDTSWGLTSWVGYREHVAGELAKGITEGVMRQLIDSP